MEVSRAGHIKAAALSIAVILFLSIGCVLGYHYLVTKSVKRIALRNKKDVEQSITELARINGDMVLVFSALDEMQTEILLQQHQIDTLMYNQELFLLINKEQTKMIRSIDQRELQRHLEVIRALAQRQKEHWPENVRAESSGLTISSRKWILPENTLEELKEVWALQNPDAPTIEEIEVDMQWNKTVVAQ